MVRNLSNNGGSHLTVHLLMLQLFIHIFVNIHYMIAVNTFLRQWIGFTFKCLISIVKLFYFGLRGLQLQLLDACDTL